MYLVFVSFLLFIYNFSYKYDITLITESLLINVVTITTFPTDR